MKFFEHFYYILVTILQLKSLEFIDQLPEKGRLGGEEII